MEEINVFLKFFENGPVDLQQFGNESSEMKRIIFSIFKIIITDLDKSALVDGLIDKFDIDNSSLWNSFELILKPELTKLNLKIEDIAKKEVDFELYNTNNILFPNKTFNQALLIGDSEEEITKKKSKKYINRINNSEQILTSNKSSIQDIENIDFFDYNEMVKFADEGVKNANFNYSESDISDLSDSCGLDDASNLKYDDFFVDAKSNVESILEKSSEYHEIDYLNLSESEITFSKNEINENLKNNTKFTNSNYLSKLNQHKDKMDMIIDEFEANIIKEKEWYKLGETSVTDREKNSLLDIHLEVPQYSSASNLVTHTDGVNNETILSDKSKVEEINPHLESIVRQRILNDLFDDVKPKIELLKALDKENKNEGTDIQTEKSKLSLAEIYSKKYEEQIIGNINEDYYDEKKQLARIFTEIMCKLDNLSNQYYATNLPILRDSVLNENTPALKTEDSIPIVISNNARLAPQEIKPQGRLLKRSEMTHPEKKSDRNSIKRKIKKKKGIDSSSKNEYAKLNDKIKVKLFNNRKKLVSKLYEHESNNKRFKSHHFIS